MQYINHRTFCVREYVEYVNHFNSVEQFAEYLGLSVEMTALVIRVGRYNRMLAIKIKQIRSYENVN